MSLVIWDHVSVGSPVSRNASKSVHLSACPPPVHPAPPHSEVCGQIGLQTREHSATFNHNPTQENYYPGFLVFLVAAYNICTFYGKTALLVGIISKS